MNTLNQFTGLELLRSIGLVPNNTIVQEADKLISALTDPPYWLIELSTEGKSQTVINKTFNCPEESLQFALRVAYEKWNNKELSNEKLSEICNFIKCKSSNESKFFLHLSWVEAELDLVELNIKWEEEHKSITKVKQSIEALLES
jgi:hypothetical protein